MKIVIYYNLDKGFENKIINSPDLSAVKYNTNMTIT